VKSGRHGDAPDFPVVVVAAGKDNGLPSVKILVHDFRVQHRATALDFGDGSGEILESFEHGVSQVLVREQSEPLYFVIVFFGKRPPQVFKNDFFAIADYFEKKKSQPIGKHIQCPERHQTEEFDENAQEKIAEHEKS